MEHVGATFLPPRSTIKTTTNLTKQKQKWGDHCKIKQVQYSKKTTRGIDGEGPSQQTAQNGITKKHVKQQMNL